MMKNKEPATAPVIKLFGKMIVQADYKCSVGSAEEEVADEEKTAATEEEVADEEKTAAIEDRRGLPCPRCESKETKFCYFNNYNVNQPRHFCKSCHRYWTAGGALRNIPVGAGRRKNHQPSSSMDAAEEIN